MILVEIWPHDKIPSLCTLYNSHFPDFRSIHHHHHPHRWSALLLLHRGVRRRRNKPSFCTISSLPQRVCCCSCAPNLGSHQSRRIEWGMLWFDESLFLIYLQIMYLSFPIRSDTVSLKVHIPESTSQSKGTRLENTIRGGHQRPRRRRRRYYYYDNVNKIKERALFLSIVCGLPRSCLCNDRGHKINV